MICKFMAATAFSKTEFGSDSSYPSSVGFTSAISASLETVAYNLDRQTSKCVVLFSLAWLMIHVTTCTVQCFARIYFKWQGRAVYELQDTRVDEWSKPSKHRSVTSMYCGAWPWLVGKAV